MILKRILACLCTFASFVTLLSQTLVPVADLSIRMNSNSTKELYYSFSEGDTMCVDLDLSNGFVRFEIIELPDQVKTSQFTAKISDYRIIIPSSKVYKFIITNGGTEKKCHLQINKISKSHKKTNVGTLVYQLKTLYDTTYTYYQEDSLVGYDTVHYIETVKEVLTKEYSDVVLTEENAVVHSYGFIDHNNPRTFIKIELPENQVTDNFEQKVHSWAFYIGVTSNNHLSMGKLLKNGVSIIPDITVIKKYLLGKVVDLAIPTGVDNVQWYILNTAHDVKNFMNNKTFSCIRNGEGAGAYYKFINKHTQGTFYICLGNQYPHAQINVSVKAVALVETITYKDVDCSRVRIDPKYVKVPKVRQVISQRQIRVPME